jgi:uncharacterized membrane protein YphA (DoxX/SURF4 family)
MDLPEVPLVASSALLTAMYFFSGLDKFGKLDKVAAGLRKRTFEAPLYLFVVVLAVSSAMLVVTSSTIVYSSISGKLRRWARASALYLVAFTVLATILYHWPPTGKTYYPFISNVTACGGLLLLSNQFRD